MAEFTFALRYYSIPGGGQDCGAARLADTLACALGARETATILARQKHAIGQGGRADATIVELTMAGSKQSSCANREVIRKRR